MGKILFAAGADPNGLETGLPGRFDAALDVLLALNFKNSGRKESKARYVLDFVNVAAFGALIRRMDAMYQVKEISKTLAGRIERIEFK